MMSLADVIASINNDLQAALSPDNATDIEIGNNLITFEGEDCKVSDAGALTAAAANTTYNNGKYGQGNYS